MEPARVFSRRGFQGSMVSLAQLPFACRLLVSVCAGSAYFTLASTQFLIAACACVFQVRSPWRCKFASGHPGFALSLLYKNKKNNNRWHSGQLPSFPNGASLCASHDIFHARSGPLPEAALPHRPALLSFCGRFRPWPAGVLIPVRWGQQPMGLSACSPDARILHLGHLPDVAGGSHADFLSSQRHNSRLGILDSWSVSGVIRTT